jgi:hypothetical protein
MKQEIYELVFELNKDTPFTYNDIKNLNFDIQDDDIISVGLDFDDFDDKCFSYHIYIERKRLETDEEYYNRINTKTNIKYKLK